MVNLQSNPPGSWAGLCRTPLNFCMSNDSAIHLSDWPKAPRDRKSKVLSSLCLLIDGRNIGCVAKLHVLPEPAVGA